MLAKAKVEGRSPLPWSLGCSGHPGSGAWWAWRRQVLGVPSSNPGHPT